MALRISLPACAHTAYWDEGYLLQKHGSDEVVNATRVKETRDVEVLVIPLESDRPEIWKATSYTYNKGDTIQEEVDLRQFFPSGSVSSLFCTIPSSDSPLPFGYRIYVDNHRTARPLNRAIDSMFDKRWIGNLVVVRYARGNTAKRRFLANIQQPEIELVVALIGDWIDRIWAEAFDVNDAWSMT